jgi:hypothetical protein
MTQEPDSSDVIICIHGVPLPSGICSKDASGITALMRAACHNQERVVEAARRWCQHQLEEQLWTNIALYQ